MKSIGKQLRPFWPIILLIVFFQVIQAYTSLLLPDYTSRLIDVGIKDGGVEYAVPVELNKNSYEKFKEIVGPAQAELIDESYVKKSEDDYQLDASIMNDLDRMERLSEKFMEPLAFYQLEERMNQAEQALFQEQLDDAALQEPDENKNLLHTTAIQAVMNLYEASEVDIHTIQQSYLKTHGIAMLGIAGGVLLSALTVHFLAAQVGANLGFQLREQTFGQVMTFSQAEINQFSTASLITRTTNDIQQIQMMGTVVLRFILFAPIMAIGGIIHVFRTGSQLSWIIAVAILAVTLIVSVLLCLTMPRFKILQTQIDRVNLIAREILTGLQVIRAFGRQDYEEQRFDQANLDLRNTQMFTNRAMSFMRPSMTIVMNATSVLIVWVAAQHISKGNLQVGTMTAFISYSMQIIFSFLIFSMLAVIGPRAMVSSKRVQDVIDTQSSIQSKEDSEIIDNVQGIIEFKDVSFKFPNADRNTLCGINFTAKPGETVAIIGGTGSGKTTILNLMLRYYDVTSGLITVDGVDIRNWNLQKLREIIGYVPQTAILFSGTVEDNVAFGVDKLSEQQLEKYTTIAHASEFIDNLPGEYQGAVSQGGANFSGGQKQRLSIARALAKAPQVYIFDDSFSALDYQTDKKVRSGLYDSLTNETVIIVAQRISTILDADKIIVLKNGTIESVGTHLELMEHSQVYQEIATSQLSEKELAQEKQRQSQRGES